MPISRAICTTRSSCPPATGGPIEAECTSASRPRPGSLLQGRRAWEQRGCTHVIGQHGMRQQARRIRTPQCAHHGCYTAVCSTRHRTAQYETPRLSLAVATHRSMPAISACASTARQLQPSSKNRMRAVGDCRRWRAASAEYGAARNTGTNGGRCPSPPPPPPTCEPLLRGLGEFGASAGAPSRGGLRRRHRRPEPDGGRVAAPVPKPVGTGNPVVLSMASCSTLGGWFP